MTVWNRRLVVALTVSLLASSTEPAAQTPGPAPANKATPAPKGVRPALPREDPLARRLCDALHTLPAKRKQECCGAAGASLSGVCTQELTAALRRGAVTLAAETVDRCATDMAHQLGGCSWVTPVLPNLPASCRSLVGGKLEARAACRSSLECKDGLYCQGLSPARAGVCAPPAAPKARCEAPADNLAAFARAKDDPRHPECSGRCTRGQCLPFASAGGACASSALCSPGLHCIAGRCESTPLPSVGESCSATAGCQAGFFCQGGQCAALRDMGAPCRLPFECRAFACEKAPGKDTGTCGNPCTGATRR